MKKTILGLAVSAMFVMGAAQAEVNPNDVSAELTVYGTVTPEVSACTVNLSQASINLNAEVASIPAQGTNKLLTDFVELNVTGSGDCSTLVSQGKMAYKFLGTADSADGTSLANVNVADGAATGVGIALYKETGEVLTINNDTLLATDTATKLGLGLVKLNGQQAVAGAVQGALTIQIERL